MLKYADLNVEERAKYLLPLRLLQLPAIFEKFATSQGLEYAYQLFPMPSDFHRSSIKGLGVGKVALLERSLNALGLPTDGTLILPNEFDIEKEQARLQSLQLDFLKTKFQPEIFPSSGKIVDLASELAANLDIIVNFPGAKNANVEREILLAYWGWSGQTSRTLDEVGQLGLSGQTVSRQRIEQSDNRARVRLDSFLRYTDHLEEAISKLARIAPIHEDDLISAMSDKGIHLGKVGAHGLLSAAEILLGGYDIYVDNKAGVIFPAEDRQWFYNTLKAIGSMTESNGACHLESLREFTLLPAYQADFVKTFLSKSPYYFWLNDDETWVFTERKRNRVENSLQKIFSITETIETQVCLEQLIKDPRIKVDLDASVLEALSKHLDFVSAHDGVLNRKYPLSFPFGRAERAFLSQLTTRPEDFDAAKIEAYAAAMDPPVISPLQILYRSPITRNVGYNDWILVGDKWNDVGEVDAQDDDVPGRQEAIEECLDQMWRYAFGASAQSGKKVQSTRKNKLIGFTKEEFFAYCRELMSEQGYVCNLTGIALDIYCLNRDFMPSADRIDSAKGYERGNIQITCSFANSWKSTYDNGHFLTLIKAVRKANTAGTN